MDQLMDLELDNTGMHQQFYEPVATPDRYVINQQIVKLFVAAGLLL